MTLFWPAQPATICPVGFSKTPESAPNKGIPRPHSTLIRSNRDQICFFKRPCRSNTGQLHMLVCCAFERRVWAEDERLLSRWGPGTPTGSPIDSGRSKWITFRSNETAYERCPAQTQLMGLPSMPYILYIHWGGFAGPCGLFSMVDSVR